MADFKAWWRAQRELGHSHKSERVVSPLLSTREATMRMPNDNQTHQDREHQRLPDRGIAAIWLVFYLLVGAYTAASLLVSSAIVANIKF